MTNDQWSLVDSNRNWAIYKTQQQNWDSGCNPCFLKNEIVKNIIYELLVFFSILVGWIQYKGVQSSHDRYRILPNKNIPTFFQAIELLGYILLAIALVYLIIEIINAYKNQYKTALRHPVIRKIYPAIKYMYLSDLYCYYIICYAIQVVFCNYVWVSYLLGDFIHTSGGKFWSGKYVDNYCRYYFFYTGNVYYTVSDLPLFIYHYGLMRGLMCRNVHKFFCIVKHAIKQSGGLF